MKALTKGERRRAEIIQIARGVLTTEGYEAFALRDIATRADMKLGNLQYYFPSKESLLEAIIRAEAENDLALLVGELDQLSEPKEQIRCFCETIISRWKGDSGRIFILMTFLSNENPLFAEIYADVYNNFYEALMPILRVLDPGHATTIYFRRALLITALIDGAPAQVTKGKFKQFLGDIADQAIYIAQGSSSAAARGY